MSSTHPLKTPPSASGTANAVGHLEASFTSPVYKVVLLPGASSPHSTLLPYRHEQSRRKIARRVSRQPVRQLQFPLSDADSDIDDIICSLEEGSDGLLVRPSRNDFTVDELRSLPIYERLPIKLEDLLSDDETAVNITVESAAASSNVEDVAIARSNGSLLSRNRANTSLSGELRETPTFLYRNKTTSLNAEQWQAATKIGQTRRLANALEVWRRRTLTNLRLEEFLVAKHNAILSRHFSKWCRLARDRVKADSHRKRTVMAKSMERWLHSRQANDHLDLQTKYENAAHHARRKIQSKALHVWRVWLLHQVDCHKEALQFEKKATLGMYFGCWKAMYLGVATSRSAMQQTQERRYLENAFARWKRAWGLEGHRRVLERRLRFRNKRKAFSSWRLYIYHCNLRKLCLMYRSQQEMVLLQSSFNHWMCRTSLLQGDVLLFSRLASAQRRELLRAAMERWVQALHLSRRTKTAIHSIQRHILMKSFHKWRTNCLCIQFRKKHYLLSCVRRAFKTWRQRLLKKDSVCRTRATRLRVYFDLWRKRTEERKERALEERSRDHYYDWLLRRYFTTWKGQFTRDMMSIVTMETVVKRQTKKFYLLCWKRQYYCVQAARIYCAKMEEGHLHQVFLAWKDTAYQQSCHLVNQFLFRLQSAMPKDELTHTCTDMSHQALAEQKLPLAEQKVPLAEQKVPLASLIPQYLVQPNSLAPQSPVQQSSPQSPVQQSSPQSPDQQSSPQSPVQQSSSQSPVQQSSSQSPVQQSSPQSPDQQSSPQSPVQQSSSQSPVQQSSPQSPVQQSSPQSPVQQSSSQSPDQQSSSQSPDQQSSPQSSDQTSEYSNVVVYRDRGVNRSLFQDTHFTGYGPFSDKPFSDKMEGQTHMPFSDKMEGQTHMMPFSDKMEGQTHMMPFSDKMEGQTDMPFSDKMEGQTHMPFSDKMEGQTHMPFSDKMEGQTHMPFSDKMEGQTHMMPFSDKMEGQTHMPFSDKMEGQTHMPFSDKMEGQTHMPFSDKMEGQTHMPFSDKMEGQTHMPFSDKMEGQTHMPFSDKMEGQTHMMPFSDKMEGQTHMPFSDKMEGQTHMLPFSDKMEGQTHMLPFSDKMEGQTHMPFSDKMEGQTHMPFSDKMEGQTDMPFSDKMEGQTHMPFSDKMEGQTHMLPFSDKMEGQTHMPFSDKMEGQTHMPFSRSDKMEGQTHMLPFSDKMEGQTHMPFSDKMEGQTHMPFSDKMEGQTHMLPFSDKMEGQTHMLPFSDKMEGQTHMPFSGKVEGQTHMLPFSDKMEGQTHIPFSDKMEGQTHMPFSDKMEGQTHMLPFSDKMEGQTHMPFSDKMEGQTHMLPFSDKMEGQTHMLPFSDKMEGQTHMLPFSDKMEGQTHMPFSDKMEGQTHMPFSDKMEGQTHMLPFSDKMEGQTHVLPFSDKMEGQTHMPFSDKMEGQTHMLPFSDKMEGQTHMPFSDKMEGQTHMLPFSDKMEEQTHMPFSDKMEGQTHMMPFSDKMEGLIHMMPFSDKMEGQTHMPLSDKMKGQTHMHQPFLEPPKQHLCSDQAMELFNSETKCEQGPLQLLASKYSRDDGDGGESLLSRNSWNLPSNNFVLPRMCVCVNAEIRSHIQKVRERLEYLSRTKSSAGESECDFGVPCGGGEELIGTGGGEPPLDVVSVDGGSVPHEVNSDILPEGEQQLALPQSDMCAPGEHPASTTGLSGLHEAVHSSPSLLTRLVCTVRYIQLYPCSKLFYMWRGYTHRKATLRRLVRAYQSHKLELRFKQWRESTRVSMELAALEVRLRQGLDSVSAKRCMEVWRKALQMRLSEQSREAWAIQHHTHTVIRRALSTWRCANQHTVAAEAEKAVHSRKALLKRLALQSWRRQARRRHLSRRALRQWKHFTRVTRLEKQAQLLTRYWTLSDAWSAWRRALVTQRTLMGVTNTALLRTAFLSWRLAIQQPSS